MSGNIQREAVTLAKTLDSTLADTPALLVGNYAGGIITIPTGSSITSLEWHVAESENGTYLPLYKKDDSAVVTPSTVQAARAYPFPDEVFAAKYLKIKTNADGAVTLHFKS